MWSVPGGWADINESPSANILREVREETGFEAKVVKLLALFDKHCHDHPPQFPHAYKAFFQCEIIGGKATKSLETDAVDFFALDQLPPLSTHRVTLEEIQCFHKMLSQPDCATKFD